MFGKPKPKRPGPFEGAPLNDPRTVAAGVIQISQQLDYIARLLEQQQEAKRLRNEAGK